MDSNRGPLVSEAQPSTDWATTTAHNDLNLNELCFTFRPYEVLVKSGTRRQEYLYPSGTTPVISVNIKDLEVVSEEVRELPMEQ